MLARASAGLTDNTIRNDHSPRGEGTSTSQDTPQFAFGQVDAAIWFGPDPVCRSTVTV